MEDRNTVRDYVRIVLSLYLFYVSFGIIQKILNGEDIAKWLLIASFIFIAFGVWFIWMSVKHIREVKALEEADARAELEKEAQEAGVTVEELKAQNEPKKPMSLSEKARLVQSVEEGEEAMAVGDEETAPEDDVAAEADAGEGMDSEKTDIETVEEDAAAAEPIEKK